MPDYLEPKLQDSELMGAYSNDWDSSAVEEAKKGLAIGTIIKLCLTSDNGPGERMWFEVAEIIKNGYVATCSNDPVFPENHGVTSGDRVRFEPRHVLSIYKGQ